MACRRLQPREESIPSNHLRSSSSGRLQRGGGGGGGGGKASLAQSVEGRRNAAHRQRRGKKRKMKKKKKRRKMPPFGREAVTRGAKISAAWRWRALDFSQTKLRSLRVSVLLSQGLLAGLCLDECYLLQGVCGSKVGLFFFAR
jgi:hypothetical protein